jgi:hypothetical protein
MTRTALIIMVATLATSAVAADPVPGAQDTRRELREALEVHARTNTAGRQVTLPDSASDRAREVHDTIAFGKRGAEKRAANAKGAEASSRTSSSAGGGKGAQSARGEGSRAVGHAQTRAERAGGPHPGAGPK